MIVLIKTHVWNDDLEEYLYRVDAECRKVGVSMIILMHGAERPLPFKAMFFDEGIIKAMYPSGFIDMQLSNHWSLIWAYRQLPEEDWFWSVEYDVRIRRSDLLWTIPDTEDFLYVQGGRPAPPSPYMTTLQNIEAPHYTGYLQLARYSRRLLQYLDDCYAAGQNGQDELATYSLVFQSQFTSLPAMNQYTGGVWTWQAEYSLHNRKKYAQSRKLAIFHPCK